MTFKERVTIGDKSLLASLAAWGLISLALLALILTIIASVTKQRGPGEFPDGLGIPNGDFQFPDGSFQFPN